jgi:hypothetical protein
MARDELLAETRADVPADLIARAWKRIVLTNDVSLAALEAFVVQAKTPASCAAFPTCHD